MALRRVVWNARVALAALAAMSMLVGACTPTDPGTGTTTTTSAGGVVTAVQVAEAVDHGCAVMSDHTVRCWGNNRGGQLGNGTASGGNSDSSTAQVVVGLTDATQVTVGNFFSCALRSTGAVACWGENSQGRLGNGDITVTRSTTPVQVVGITNATSVGANDGAAYAGACASLSTGVVKCWGSNYEGVLGTASIPTKNSTPAGGTATPVSVDGITNAARVSVGFSHACALLTDTTVKCWGRNVRGELGDASLPQGQSVYIPTPVTVVGLSGVTQLSVGSVPCVMVGGVAKCWGRLGGSATPTPINGDPGFTTVVAMDGQGCGIRSVAASCWGWNDQYQLGSTAWPCCEGLLTPVATVPQPVSNLTAAVASIGAGYNNACAVLTNGQVWCWGYDLWGALGTGTNTQGDGTGMSPVGRAPQKVVGIL